MKQRCTIPRRLGAMASVLVLLLAPLRLAAAATAQIFATPEAAVATLSRAVADTNRAALVSLFGPASQALVNPDEVQAANELAEFAAALQAANRLVRHSDSRMVLEIGGSRWPFPIPLVKVAGGWHFDTAAGLDELLNRRIGQNELDVLRVLRACVQAQREYASSDRDGDGVLEFAQRIHSSPGRADGLYWPSEATGEISPLGPLVALAQSEGYSRTASATDAGPQPFHGYLFRLLTRQGRHAPGGKYRYVINGNMIGGFALIAWPAEYGSSGVMSFIVNQQGRVYQKDLGPSTARLAGKMTAYDPDPTWSISRE